MKKNMFSKMSALAMAVLMMAGVLFGCAGSSSSSQAGTSGSGQTSSTGDSSNADSTRTMVSDVPVTFTVLYADNSDYPLKKDWATLQEMTRLTNVSFDIQAVPDSDYGTKQQLIFNSGSIPDIVMKTGPDPEYALNGIFLPISDYLDQMPNLKAFVENEIPLEWENYRLKDGKIYTIPTKISEKYISNQTWFLRKDLLDEVGLPVPTTMDEFYDACVAIKEKHPDIFPIGNRFTPDNILCMMAPSFETQAGWGLQSHGFIYNKAADKWEFAPTTNGYRQLLETVRKFMEDGLIDPEFNTLDSDIFMQRWASGKIFAATDWPDTALQSEIEGKVNNPDFDIVATLPFAGPTGVAQYPSVVKSTSSWVIPATAKDNENFETLLRFIDWLYTDEAGDLFTWGVEGVTYTVENGKKTFMDDIQTAINPEGTINATREYGVNNNNFTMRQSLDWRIDFMLGEENGALQEKMNEMNSFQDPTPTLHIPEDMLEEVMLYSTALTDYYKSMAERFIYGKESFDNWEQYEFQCGEKGRDKLDVIINDAWKAQNQ